MARASLCKLNPLLLSSRSSSSATTNPRRLRLDLKLAADSGDADRALLIFAQIRSLDAFCVNSVLRSFSRSPDPSRAPPFYFQMLHHGLAPNSYTFTSLLASCARAASATDARKCHAQALKNGEDRVVQVANALLHSYASCGLPRCARQVFDEMPQRDLVSWNSMVDACLKAGELASARQLFQEMPGRNVVSWNVVIAGCVRAGNPGAGMKLFREMARSGVRGSVVTMVSVVTACARSARGREGRSVHGFWVRCFAEGSLVFETALIWMYCRCGRTEDARMVFDRMSERNLVCWNVMVLGLCIHGHPHTGLALFEQMVANGSKGEGKSKDSQQEEQFHPDEVTFVGVLCACTRAGLLSEGKKYFTEMTSVYKITPTFAHHWCMANLYGSLGRLQEAEETLKSMPEKPESLVWGGLLGLCRFRGDVELGERIAKHLIELEPFNHSRYALLWNVYAVAGQWEDVTKVKDMMMERGLRPTLGSSLVNLNEIVHGFEVGDRSQPDKAEVYLMIDEVVGTLMLQRNSFDPMEFGL